eukprot:1406502-Rhodomonas_salina.1
MKHRVHDTATSLLTLGLCLCLSFDVRRGVLTWSLGGASWKGELEDMSERGLLDHCQRLTLRLIHAIRADVLQ